MSLYHRLEADYQRLANRPLPGWLTPDLGPSLAAVVDAIRRDQPDPTRSDEVLRAVVAAGNRDPDALTVALWALTPRLRATSGKAATQQYRDDMLAELLFVLSDVALDGTGLARRLVSRAHTRAWRAARAEHTSSSAVHPVAIQLRDPQRLADHDIPCADDVAELVAARADLCRFHRAVEAAVAAGDVAESGWMAYRDHRLGRLGLGTDRRPGTSRERMAAHRAGVHLARLAARHLRAA